MRRLTFVALGLLLLGLVASILATALSPEHNAGRQSPEPAHGRETPAARPPSAALPARELVGARAAAERFLAGYLPLTYGRGSARSVKADTPRLRRQLARARARITPVERRARARVVSLTAVAPTPGIVIATVLIADRAVTSYALRITVREGPGGWLVSGIDGR